MISCGCFLFFSCQLGLLWLSLHNHFIVGQNRIYPSPDFASLVGAFVVSILKSLKPLESAMTPFKSVAIMRALISLAHTPNVQAADDNQGYAFLLIVE